MSLSLTHTFVSTISDGTDTTLVRPSNWNAQHTITMATAKVLGRATAGTGTVEELSTTGTGSVVLATSPVLVTPSLGVATATSLAIGGATLGTDALAITGSVTLSGTLNIGTSATSIRASNPSTLIFNAGSQDIVQVIGNTTPLRFDVGANAVAFGSGLGTTSTDVRYEATGVIAQRRLGDAQELRIYQTTDAGTANYARGYIGWVSDAGIFEIGTQKAGTGTATDIQINPGAAGNLYLGSAASARWKIDTSGNFLAQSDNAYDIGASGATRPRNVYIAGTLFAGATTITGSFTATGLVTNADLANATAYTFKGNATGSSAAPADFTIAGLTHKAVPTTADLLIISDEAASHATKYSTIGEAVNLNASVRVPTALSSITQVSHTGDTAEFTLATIAIPALAAGASLEITVMFSAVGTAGAKTLKMYYGATSSGTGGTNYYNIATGATALQTKAMFHIWNRTTSSQFGGSNTAAGTGSATGAFITSAVTTTGATELTITGQLANSGDTTNLEGYMIKIVTPSS